MTKLIMIKIIEKLDIFIKQFLTNYDYVKFKETKLPQDKQAKYKHRVRPFSNPG